MWTPRRWARRLKPVLRVSMVSSRFLTLSAVHPRFSRFLPSVRRTLLKCLPCLTKRPVQLGVFLVSDTEMRRINKRVRGKDQPTNVLSFSESVAVPHPELPDGIRALGEIFLAPDLIARKGEDLEALAVHGLLHLFGYTHGRARDRIEMETKESELHAKYYNRGNKKRSV